MLWIKTADNLQGVGETVFKSSEQAPLRRWRFNKTWLMREVPSAETWARDCFPYRTARARVQQWQFHRVKRPVEPGGRRQRRGGEWKCEGRLGKEWRCYSNVSGKPLEDFKLLNKYKSLIHLINKISGSSVESTFYWGE